jgi:hypothetical protein
MQTPMAALRCGRADRRALFARCPPRELPAYPAFHADHSVPAPQEPLKTDDRRHPGRDHRRPHQHSSQPHAPLNSDDPLLRMPKPGQLVHAHRDAHDRLGETWLGETRYTGSNAGEGLFDQPSVPRSGDRGVDRLVKVSRGSCRATARAMHRLTSVVALWEGVSCSAQSSIPLRFSYATDRRR